MIGLIRSYHTDSYSVSICNLALGIWPNEVCLSEAISIDVPHLTESSPLQEILNRTFFDPESQPLTAHKTVTAHIADFTFFPNAFQYITVNIVKDD